MPRYIVLFISLLMNMIIANAHTQPDTTNVSLKIIETTDVHGNFFHYDFINQKAWDCSLSQVSTYVNQQREALGNDNVILLDNGDILQGQPTVYYYNFIDTTSVHIATKIMNYMKYDVATIGNHDIETGHSVYDRWVSQCNFPILGANVTDITTNKPYFKPYHILNRNGIKIAIMGMITPAVPSWLPQNLWSGLRFDSMIDTARLWVSIIKEQENPDVIIGLFHSGSYNKYTSNGIEENASIKVAQEVPGFDIIFTGHDHQLFCDRIKNIDGKDVYIINPANNACNIGEAEITFNLLNEEIVSKDISTKIVSVREYKATDDFNAHFNSDKKNISDFVSQKIGYCDKTISTRDAYFGASAFIDFIHQLQLNLSGADISFAAPLSFNATINQGDILMSDMFNLYKFENMLYTMRLTGEEIKNYLEMSYDLWINTMTSPNDHLLKLETTTDGRLKFRNPTYNFDSAAGLLYTVDVTKEKGNRINISSMADGSPFYTDTIYNVAINSYRGNGGGGLLTEGAGIPANELSNRITWSTDIDLRYYMMKEIEKAGTISPRQLNQWRFIPENIANMAATRDRALLFK